jgi:hypothetical protein
LIDRCAQLAAKHWQVLDEPLELERILPGSGAMMRMAG